MGESAGAGSPVSFKCRRDRYGPDRRGGDHRWELTGRRRRYRTKYGSALGVRSTLISREYRCSCGATGWSNHVDLARLAGEDPYARIES